MDKASLHSTSKKARIKVSKEPPNSFEKKRHYDASKYLTATLTVETLGYGPKTLEEAQRPGKTGVSLIDLENALSKHNACTVDYEKLKDYISERMKFKKKYYQTFMGMNCIEK